MSSREEGEEQDIDSQLREGAESGGGGGARRWASNQERKRR